MKRFVLLFVISSLLYVGILMGHGVPPTPHNAKRIQGKPVQDTTGNLVNNNIMKWNSTSGEWEYAAEAGASGTADSMSVDTDGDGTIDAYLYSTVAAAFNIKKGTNITLVVDNDTLIISATGGGSDSSLFLTEAVGSGVDVVKWDNDTLLFYESGDTLLKLYLTPTNDTALFDKEGAVTHFFFTPQIIFGDILEFRDRIEFEGTTVDGFEHRITVVDPTAVRTFTFPNDQIAAGDVLVGSGATNLAYLALATTEILIGDGSGIPTAAALSKDVTMTNAGVVTIDTTASTISTYVQGQIEDSLDEYSITTNVVLRDGSQTLTGNWDVGDVQIVNISRIEADTIEAFTALADLYVIGGGTGNIIIFEAGSNRWEFENNRLTGVANATILLDSLIAVSGNILVNSNFDLNSNDIIGVDSIHAVNYADNSVADNDINWGTGATQVSIIDVPATNWNVFYSNGSGVITELAIGASGLILKSNGTASAPTWQTDAGAGLTFFTEADDNDTSVFTATGPNTTVGFNDNLTMQDNDITGVEHLKIDSLSSNSGGQIQVGNGFDMNENVLGDISQLTTLGNVAGGYGVYLNKDGGAVSGRLFAFNNGSNQGMFILFDSVGNEIEFSDDLNMQNSHIVSVDSLDAGTGFFDRLYANPASGDRLLFPRVAAATTGHVLKVNITPSGYDSTYWAADNTGGGGGFLDSSLIKEDTVVYQLVNSSAQGGINDTLLEIMIDTSTGTVYIQRTLGDLIVFKLDTININGDRIGDFAGNALSVSSGVLNVGLATSGVAGAANFPTDNFLVTAGSVAIKAGGIDSDEIANQTIDSVDVGPNAIGESELDLGSGAQQVGIEDMNSSDDWSTVYWNATVPVTLPLGSSGQVLKSNGTASAPTWQADATGSGPWAVGGVAAGVDTTAIQVDADDDTTAVITDDDAGAVVWSIGADQTSLTIGVSGATTIIANELDLGSNDIIGVDSIHLASMADNVIDSNDVVANALSIPSDLAVATKAELEGRISDVADFAEADGETYSNAHIFTSATLEIPNAATTAPTAEAQLIYDTGDDWLVTEDADGGTEYVLAKKMHIETRGIDNPEALVYDTVNIFYVNADVYPAGIVITGWGFTRITTTSSTLELLEMSDGNTVVSSIETITTCTTEECEDDGSIADPNIAAGNYVMLDYNDVDESFFEFWITYYIPDN